MEKKIDDINKFKIRICSDLDYEGMVVDIVYNNETLATLNQDSGVDNIEIKLFSNKKDFWEFSLDEFQKNVEEAKKTLIQFNKD